MLTEALILVGGPVVMPGATPRCPPEAATLGQVTRPMSPVDLLRPGQRLPAHGGGVGSTS